MELAKTIGDFPVYSVIPDTTNIATLVKNVINDDLFNRYISALKESPVELNKSKADIITNTVSNIRVFNNNLAPLFLAKDIGILLGISHINYLIRKFDNEEMSVGYVMINNKTKKVIFLTRHGIYRCFFISKSPLAKVFRKFIGNLLDHMITHETELLHRISSIFKTENADLIEKGINDLNNRLIEYEAKYKEECAKAAMLEEQVNDEFGKRKELEKENTEIEIINNYNMMHIEQLKKEKSDCVNKIKNLQYITINLNESESSELKMIKEKFMKPVYIYILHPTYFTKLLNNQLKMLVESARSAKKDAINSKKNNLDPSIDEINDLLDDMRSYQRNFDIIFNKQYKLETDEILHFHISATKKTEKINKLIYVDTQWITNKKHLLNTCSVLNGNCSTILLNKLLLYKTSIEEIKDSIRDTFAN